MKILILEDEQRNAMRLIRLLNDIDTTFIIESDYPFMHLLYSQLLVCQRVCLQNTVCLICK